MVTLSPKLESNSINNNDNKRKKLLLPTTIFLVILAAIIFSYYAYTRKRPLYDLNKLKNAPNYQRSGPSKNLLDMLTAIYSIPDIQYHEFTGPYLTVNEEGRIRSDCKQLFKSHQSPPTIWPPPKTMPSDMFNGFTMNGLIPVLDNYRFSENEKANGGKGTHWSKEKIVDMGSLDNTCGAYNHKECEQIIQKYGEKFIENKKGVVIGSSTPWAEAALLAAGASHITTIEYRNITTNHPNLTTYRPLDIAHQYLSGKWKPVDFLFTYSSVEHDGLGRYGDPLNPYGDLEAFAKAKCLLKPGGVLFVGLPVGPDAILWNAHRQYGPIRFKLMLNMGWVPIDLVGEPFKSITELQSPKYNTDHPIWLLRKGGIDSDSLYDYSN